MPILNDLLAALGSPIAGRSDLPDPPPPEPMALLHAWLEDATKSGKYADPNAMTLATCTRDGIPSARIVLCKAIEPAPPAPSSASPAASRDPATSTPSAPSASPADAPTMAVPHTAGPPALVFFTNYQSPKARDLLDNPRVACVFHWPHAQRQARITGEVVKVSDAESDEYFRSRHPLSRIGAWASKQSQPLQSRNELIAEAVRIAGKMTAGSVGGAMENVGRAVEDALRSVARAVGVSSSTPSSPHDAGAANRSVSTPSSMPSAPSPAVTSPSATPSDLFTRPPWWGGFRVLIRSVELWSAREGRLHDRFNWELTTSIGVAPPSWHVARLSP